MGSCWGHFGSNFHKNYGRQGPESEKWTPKVAYRRRMARVMHIASPCVRPKRVHKQNLVFCEGFCLSKKPGGFSENEPAAIGHFGVVLGALRGHFAHVGVTLGSL